MPYIDRDASGQIVGSYARAQRQNHEFLPDGDPEWVAYNKPTAIQLKADGALAVDRQAESTRLLFITPGAGQAMSYLRKESQARDCLTNYTAASPPPAGKYTALEAEVGINGADVLAVAATVVATADAWASVADIIEGLRLQAKKDITALPDAPTLEADIQALVDAIVWPAP